MSRANVTISLTPELKHFVEAKVSAGGYQSTSEVIREGLRLLRNKDEDEQARRKIRDDIEIGWQQAQNGMLVDPEEAYRRIVKGAAARARKRRQ